MTRPIKLPKSIKVGCYTYVLKEWCSSKTALSDHGGCDHANLEIGVDVSRAPEQTANTLIHEILHAIWHVWGIEKGDSEERIVNKAANGLQAVLNENGELRQTLLQTLLKR